MDGQPPSLGWSPIIQNPSEGSVLHTDLKFGTWTQLTESKPGKVQDGQPQSPGWSPTIQRMVTHHLKSTP